MYKRQLWDPFAGTFDLGDADGRGLAASAINDVGDLAGQYAPTSSNFNDLKPWFGSVRLAPQPPGAPAGSAAADGNHLTWAAPLSPGDAAVDEYRIYRSGTLAATVAGDLEQAVDPVAMGGAYTLSLIHI